MRKDVPVVLSSSLFSAFTQELSGNGNCDDCACPDNGFSQVISVDWEVDKLQQPFLHKQILSSEHLILFNPYHNGGVAVLNQTAVHLWNEFQTPRSIFSLFEVNNYDAVAAARKMLQFGLLQPAETRQNLQQGRPQTLSVWLHVTNECNLRCDYCYISKTVEPMTPEVGFAAIDTIIRSATSDGFQRVKLKYAGGEASLNLKLVFALHEYAQEKTTEAGLTLDSIILTNGVAIGDREISKLQELGIRITISLDGIGEAHDTQRRFKNGRGSFAWVNRSIEKLLTYGIKPFISITVSNRNAAHLPDVVRYVLERDLPFNLNFYRENDCSAVFTDLQMQDDHFIAQLHQVFDVIEENLPHHSLLSSLVDRAQFDQPHNKPCGVNESYMVIDHHGRIAQCHMEIEKPVTTIYVKNPLQRLKTDTIYLQNIPVEEKDGCRECEWRYWCAGGCPVLTYRSTGRYDVRSPYCNVYKAIYPRLLRLEGLRLLMLNSERSELMNN